MIGLPDTRAAARRETAPAPPAGGPQELAGPDAGAAPAGVVGVVLKAYPRLSETFIVREILALESRGIALHLFAMRAPRERAVHDDVARVRAPLTYVPDAFDRSWREILGAARRVRRARPDTFDPLARFALGESLRARRFATLKRFLQAAWLVDRGLPGCGVTHLHAHFANDPTTVAWFAARLAGLGYSFSAHAKDVWTQEPAWLARKIDDARFVVTCTEHNRARLEALAENGASVLRAYHGIRTDRFAPAAAAPPGDPLILSVGRLVPKKGFATLLAAFRALADRGVPFRGEIVGEGPLRAELAATINRLGLAGHVLLPGPMSQGALLERYRAARAFAIACEVQADGDRDGIPNVVVEAMAMGLPVVATRVSGIPECVADGVTGLLVPERDPAALAEALARVLEDPALGRGLGQAGRVRIEREFDADANLDVIDRALRGALAAAGKEARHGRSA